MRDTLGKQVASPSLLLYRLQQAVQSGARVVNLSISTNVNGGSPTAQQDREIAIWGTYVHSVFESNDPQQRVLLVLSAGNGGGDVYWSGLSSGIRDSLANQSIVVTGSTRSGVIHSAANIGTRVDVAAPGDSLQGMRSGMADTVVTGTSFATPMVSGLAALLVHFDSTLSGPDLKARIVEGAQDGGVTAARSGSSYPVIDYYAALRRAGRRTGGPLCGGFTTLEDGYLVAYRDSTVRDVLLQVSGGTEQSWVQPRHGGRRIDFSLPMALLRASWMGGSTWQVTDSLSWDGDGAEGSILSSGGSMHDGDTSIVVAQIGTTSTWKVGKAPWSTDTTIHIANITSFTGAQNYGYTVYPMIGDTALIVVNQWTENPDGTWPLTNANIYKFHIPTGNYSLYWQESGRGVVGLMFSEDQKTMLIHTNTVMSFEDASETCTIEHRIFSAARTLVRPAITTGVWCKGFGIAPGTLNPRARSRVGPLSLQRW